MLLTRAVAGDNVGEMGYRLLLIRKQHGVRLVPPDTIKYRLTWAFPGGGVHPAPRRTAANRPVR